MSNWKVVLITLLVIVITVILTVFQFVCNKTAKHADTIANNAIVNYEEFQEMYNTCVKINTDLGVIRKVDEKDKMFEQFSKSQRIAALQMQMNRWVEEYNSKSKMWTKSVWKSDKLPYQLNVNQFPNY